jgi:hypothetical protein
MNSFENSSKGRKVFANNFFQWIRKKQPILRFLKVIFAQKNCWVIVAFFQTLTLTTVQKEETFFLYKSVLELRVAPTMGLGHK